MDPIQILMNEHRVIEQVLTALEEVVGNLAKHGETDREQLGRFVMFLREFADAVHHSKEEDILFVQMTKHGFAQDNGPLAVMLNDHETSRGYVKILREAAERVAQPWTSEEAEQVVRAAKSYSELLRVHIFREDNFLYKMAQRHIPSDEMYVMGKQFAAMISESESNGAKQRLVALAEELTGQHVTESVA